MKYTISSSYNLFECINKYVPSQFNYPKVFQDFFKMHNIFICLLSILWNGNFVVRSFLLFLVVVDFSTSDNTIH